MNPQQARMAAMHRGDYSMGDMSYFDFFGFGQPTAPSSGSVIYNPGTGGDLKGPAPAPIDWNSFSAFSNQPQNNQQPQTAEQQAAAQFQAAQAVAAQQQNPGATISTWQKLAGTIGVSPDMLTLLAIGGVALWALPSFRGKGR